MSDLIREPYNGIYYYANKGNEVAVYRGYVYDLRIVRDTLGRARTMAKAYKHTGYSVVVRKIAFHKGGMFRKDKGPHTIYRYGVYTREAED